MALSDRLLQNTPTSLPGNLNRAEMEMLQESETGSMRIMQEMLTRFMESGDPQIKDMIGNLLSAGLPIRDVLEQVQRYMQEGDVGGRIAAGESGSALMSTAEGQFGGSPHSGGPFWRQYNQGGIVSLRHLIRPLGI